MAISNPRDANRIPVISGVSSLDGSTVVLPFVDPTTHRLLVDLAGVVMSYDLSSQLNGVANTFTVPANTNFILVVSSSNPFVFRPTVDYTGSGTTTLTFDVGIDPATMLASGQSLILLFN